jgi:CheY-like chemotaxis protein
MSEQQQQSTVDPKTDLFRKYIANQKVLIADTSAVTLASLSNTLVSLGANKNSVIATSNFNDAQHELTKNQPKIVICDYDLGNHCGLELVQKQRHQHPESKDTLFILVTGNTSQTAVARAAEEDVDTYILKPYTTNIIRDSIIKLALSKSNPSEYKKKIEEGKAQLNAGKADEALASFEEATKLDSAPSLAFFYLGQANLVKQALDVAEGNYGKGLSYNKIHYKCLVGLYEIYMAQKRYNEAYDVVKKLSQYFPANPARLTAVLKLAILTKNPDDIEKYYQVFTRIDDRNEEVIKHVCAALVVAGKYYLAKTFKSRAMELFNKAAATAAGRPRILSEMVKALIDAELPKEAREILKQFPPDSHASGLYQSLELWIAHQLNSMSSEAILDRGRSLIAKNLHDPLLYKLMIRLSIEAGLKPAAEQLAGDAAKHWPDQQQEFRRILDAA